jgi:hypothetical protein
MKNNGFKDGGAKIEKVDVLPTMRPTGDMDAVASGQA